MQTGEADFPRVEHFLDSRHERNTNAVTELHPIEAKIDNLAQHFAAVGVPP